MSAPERATEADRCRARTRAGWPCQRLAYDGTVPYCRVHAAWLLGENEREGNDILHIHDEPFDEETARIIEEF